MPGARQIPVTASLNQGTSQDFIVDTGASMVTIPYSTAADLGIIITVRNPRRTVYTAGGVMYAPEVVLDSITLEGFETYNVSAGAGSSQSTGDGVIGFKLSAPV